MPTESDIQDAPPQTAVSDDPASMADPPDEIIERMPRPSKPSIIPTPSKAQASWLAGVVGDMKSDYGYKLRMVAILLCVLMVSLHNFVLGGYIVSYTISMLVLDCALTVWLVWSSKAQAAETYPLGWLAMLSVPLSFLHPFLPSLFENFCLFVILLTVFFRDILVVVFCSVLTFSLITVFS